MKTLNNFIVFEGLDGSGKSVQAAMLTAQLKNRGRLCSLDTEPTRSDIGKLIRATLKGASDVSPDALAWLFAADRYQHLYDPIMGVVDRTKRDEIVICDRYVLSSLAYQGSYVSDSTLIQKLNGDFPLPTLLIYIDISVDVAIQRIDHRGETLEMFDKRDQLEKISDAYDKLLRSYKGDKIILNGAKSIAGVGRDIWSVISNKFKI